MKSIAKFRESLHQLSSKNIIRLFRNQIKLVLMLSFLLTSSMDFSAFGQSLSARVSFTSSGASTAVGTCNLNIPDSTDCQVIELELTDLMKKEVLFSREYTFDQTSGLPTGITWHRDGVKVTLGLGELPKKLAWQGKVRLKNGSGQWSNPYTFLFN